MAEFIHFVLAAVDVFLRSLGDKALEVLILRQQVVVLKRKLPWPRLNRLDRFLRTTLHRVWSRWAEVLVALPESGKGRARCRPSGSRTQTVSEGLPAHCVSDGMPAWPAGIRWEQPLLDQGFGNKGFLNCLH